MTSLEFGLILLFFTCAVAGIAFITYMYQIVDAHVLRDLSTLCKLCNYNNATDYRDFGNQRFNHNYYTLIECDSQHIIKNDGLLIYPNKWEPNLRILANLDCNYKEVDE